MTPAPPVVTPLRSLPTIGAGALGLLTALLLGGCWPVDRDEFTATEWERLTSLSQPPPSTRPAQTILRGLGAPARDTTNNLVSYLRSPTCSTGNEPLTKDGYPVIFDENETSIVALSPAAALGKQLYFDRRFSGKATLKDAIGRPAPYARAPEGQPIKVSCHDCHNLDRAGADPSTLPVSVGAGWYDVNSQPTVNAAFYTLFYWNGRSDSLWSQASAVNKSKFSMNSTVADTAKVMRTLYASAYQDVFCRDVNTDTDDVVFLGFVKSIAAYEHTLIRGDSAFDRFVADGPQSTHISAAAKRGARLFVGKAGCIDCHNGVLLSDQKFHNVGVPQVGQLVPTRADCASTPTEGALCVCQKDAATDDTAAGRCPPWGAWNGLRILRQSMTDRRDSASSDNPSDDSRIAFLRTLGLAASDASPDAEGYGIPQKLDASLIAAWRTPGLRDVALTAPYMHDGAYATLEDVIWHYDQGGTVDPVDPDAVRAVQLAPLRLTQDEQQDLVAFLKTLTGAPLPDVIAKPPALPPDPTTDAPIR